jgi:hypothetical protein
MPRYKVRDLTDRQYSDALRRRGFGSPSPLGYVVHADDPNFHIPPVLKKGFAINRRASLAHAIRRHAERMKERN